MLFRTESIFPRFEAWLKHWFIIDRLIWKHSTQLQRGREIPVVVIAQDAPEAIQFWFWRYVHSFFYLFGHHQYLLTGLGWTKGSLTVVYFVRLSFLFDFIGVIWMLFELEFFISMQEQCTHIKPLARFVEQSLVHGAEVVRFITFWLLSLYSWCEHFYFHILLFCGFKRTHTLMHMF